MKCVHRPCLLCGADDVEILADLEFGDFDGALLDRRVTVVACQSCGHVYNDVNISPDEAIRYYRDEALYAAEMGVGSGGASAWDLKRYAFALEAFKSFLPSRNAAIVDVGCAKGGFLSFLKEQGYGNLLGVDINADCIDFVRNVHGIPAQTGAVQRLPLGDAQADLLVYGNVLEHVHDPPGVLAEARRVLKSGGLLFVDLPDAARYGDYPVSDFYWFSQREHVNHFDSSHLRFLGEMVGFEPMGEGTTLMSIAARVETPLIYGIFRKADPGDRAMPSPDGLRETIRRYVEAQNRSMASRRDDVRTLAQSGRPVYVWGIGLEFFCQYVQAGLRECNIRFLVDKNPGKQGRTVDGLPIRAPQVLRDAPADAVTVITSALHRKAMTAHLEEIRFAGEVVVLA